MEDILSLDNQLCFALYACSKELLRKYEPVLAPLGLTYTQYIVMLALWEQEGQTVKSLGEALRLDSGTLTPLLKRMEAKGFLEKRRSARDERLVEVLLTGKGRALREQALEIPEKMLCITGFSSEGAAALRETLWAFLTRLREEEEPGRS